MRAYLLNFFFTEFGNEICFKFIMVLCYPELRKEQAKSVKKTAKNGSKNEILQKN